MMMYADLIGKPFKDGGRGPDAYDCYGLLREIYRRHGVGLPEINVSVYACQAAQGLIDEEAARAWEEIDEPESPCGILTIPHAGFAQHIGVYVGNRRMLHTNIKAGVICDRLSEWKNKIVGYYRYVGNNHICS